MVDQFISATRAVKVEWPQRTGEQGSADRQMQIEMHAYRDTDTCVQTKIPVLDAEIEICANVHIQELIQI